MTRILHSAIGGARVNGRGYAPCGVKITTVASIGLGESLGSSTDALGDVTCEGCRVLISQVAKAHAKAKRKKEIQW